MVSPTSRVSAADEAPATWNPPALMFRTVPDQTGVSSDVPAGSAEQPPSQNDARTIRLAGLATIAFGPVGQVHTDTGPARKLRLPVG